MEVVYRCSLCQQTFDSEHDCLEHETRQHAEPTQIASFGRYGGRYPGEVLIRFSDGSEVVYRYSHLKYEGEG